MNGKTETLSNKHPEAAVFFQLHMQGISFYKKKNRFTEEQVNRTETCKEMFRKDNTRKV